MSKLEKIKSDILSLTADEKDLISIFIKDSQVSITSDYQKTWQSELQNRLNEVKSGKVGLVSASATIAELRGKLGK